MLEQLQEMDLTVFIREGFGWSGRCVDRRVEEEEEEEVMERLGSLWLCRTKDEDEA